MASEKPVLSSIRARMTFAFALQTAALMALIAGGLLFYLHYTAVQAAETTLNTAAARVTAAGVFKLPATCGALPVKSRCKLPPSTRSATTTTMSASVTPSPSSRSIALPV